MAHASERHSHPFLFMILILPFGVMGGYLTVSVAYLLAQAGIPVEQIAALVALSYIPHTWKFAWAPIADVTLNRRTWYLIGGVVSAIGIFATGVLPAKAQFLPMLSLVVLVSNFAVTFLGMSVESLMAYGTPEHLKGRAGGWFQAGNLGGNGLGGGLGLWIAQHSSAPWMAGAVLGGACFLCSIALFFIPEPPPSHTAAGLRRNLAEVAIDLWNVARSRLGFLALVLCFLPIGSGAASGLWSAVANDWRASADLVALVTGVLGGIVMALGCLIGGFVCDRMDRKAAYVAYGVLQAVCAVGMALAPRTPHLYTLFTIIYALITGLTYAGFSAFVLEAMGRGAAATKYSAFASLSNTPIWYMTLIDGAAHQRFGSGGMLLAEAAFGAIGLLVFLGVTAVVPRKAADAPEVVSA
jgi:MFS family permease